MGKFQNPFLECNLHYLRAHKIPLFRRESGGGCVYHDLGNLNFCFIYPERDHNKDKNLHFLKSAFKELGHEIEIGSRGELTYLGKKFSGSAFKQKKDRAYHHGTLLFKSNLEHLERSLTIKSKEKVNQFETKASKSVSSIVENLPCRMEDFLSLFEMKQVKLLDSTLIKDFEPTFENIEMKTPRFRFENTIAVLVANKGVIESFEFCEHPNLSFHHFENAVKGRKFIESSMTQLLEQEIFKDDRELKARVESFILELGL